MGRKGIIRNAADMATIMFHLAYGFLPRVRFLPLVAVFAWAWPPCHIVISSSSAWKTRCLSLFQAPQAAP